MPESITCSSCGATLRVPETLLGKNVKCPKCQNTFRAEAPAPAEPEEAEERIADAPVRSSSRRSAPPPEEYDDEAPPEDEDEDRPRRGRRGRGRSAEAASLVAGPAIALMVVGGLAIALSIVSLLLNILGVGLAAAGSGRAGPGAQPDLAANAVSGIGGAIFGLCWGSLITVGAVKMKGLSSYGLAMTSCIVAMLPCNLCCLLGLPFGIWGLVMINKPEVKDAFS